MFENTDQTFDGTPANELPPIAVVDTYEHVAPESCPSYGCVWEFRRVVGSTGEGLVPLATAPGVCVHCGSEPMRISSARVHE